MSVNREELLTALRTVLPALADKELVEPLIYVCFSGSTVTAFNDTIAIEAPLETPFKGALLGKYLYGLVESSGKSEIGFERTDKGMRVIASAKADLAIIELDEWRDVFTMPDPGKSIKLPDELREALVKAMLAVGEDLATPDYLGVTWMFADGKVEMFATNAKAVSYVLPMELSGCPRSGRIVLWPSFCRELLRLWSGGDNTAKLSIGENHVLVSIKPSGVRLYGKLIEPPAPPDYHAVIATTMAEGYAKKLVVMPDRFTNTIQRALLALEYQPGDKDISMAFNGERVVVKAKSPRVHSLEGLKLEKAHAEITDTANAELISVALPYCKYMLLGERCFVMADEAKPSYVYLVSTGGTS